MQTWSNTQRTVSVGFPGSLLVLSWKIVRLASSGSTMSMGVYALTSALWKLPFFFREICLTFTHYLGIWRKKPIRPKEKEILKSKWYFSYAWKGNGKTREPARIPRHPELVPLPTSWRHTVTIRESPVLKFSGHHHFPFLQRLVKATTFMTILGPH